jgi:hypothetical protein
VKNQSKKTQVFRGVHVRSDGKFYVGDIVKLTSQEITEFIRQGLDKRLSWTALTERERLSCSKQERRQ